jgi:hypothetical protein
MAKDSKPSQKASQPAGGQPAGGQPAGGQPAPGTSTADDVDEMNSVWTKDEIELQMRRRENQLDVIQKQGGDVTKVKEAEQQLELALVSFSKNKFVTTEKNLIEVKHKLIEMVNKLNPAEKLAYFVSIWATVPILYAIAGLSLSFYVLAHYSGIVIMGAVPLWASLAATIGASVQILVGVVKDYKTDGMITGYKSLWYLVVIPVSFAFGFIAFLLVQAGLITVSQGTFIINPANQTITTMVTNQTASSSTTSQITTSTTYNIAMPMIICFLAGYATDWFMGQLGKLAPPTGS